MYAKGLSFSSFCTHRIFLANSDPRQELTAMDMYLVAATFATVFLTEMLGDKAVFTIGALATRFRVLPVFCGIVLAFTGKMLAAVLLGHAIGGLPATVVAVTSAATFLITAIVIWFKRQEDSSVEQPAAKLWPRAVLTAFAAIFFSEWADAGQLTAAMLAARSHAPFTIWLGGTLALTTKGALALVFGVGLRRYLPGNALRYGAIACCLVMSILSALRIQI
jgi:putative Ca2+/H+ antiporter (TMEM165/GDT1 family)